MRDDTIFYLSIHSDSDCKVLQLDLGRFPFRQNFWFEGKFSGTNGRPSEVFHFFPSNRLEQKFPFHLRNSNLAGGRHLKFSPPFPMFAGERCSQAVAVFLFISYLIVQNCNCICRLKIVLNSVQISSNETATNCYYYHKVSIASSKLSKSTGSATTSICWIIGSREQYSEK